MKRLACSAVLLAVLFLVADELVAMVGRVLTAYRLAPADALPWWSHGSALVLLYAAAYGLAYAAAGGVWSAWAGTARHALLGSLLLGLLPVAALIVFGRWLPFAMVAHGPWWLSAGGWAHAYMPAIGSVLGAWVVWQWTSSRQLKAAAAA